VTVYYFDTSALVKRYAREAGSVWVAQIFDLATRNQVYTCRITSVEIVAALFQKVSRNELPRADAQQAATDFRFDWQQRDYEIVEVSALVADEAMRLAETYAMRGFDAIQLAAAIAVNRARLARQLAPLIFVSADVRQLACAGREQLPVDDPNAQP
jgi:predicted nucleic acid-binding protein